MPSILIVEDDADLAALFAMSLKKAGFNTHTAENAATAIRLHGEIQPDLVLLDINLPGTDGLSVLKRFTVDQARGGHVSRVVMVSRRDSIDDIAEATDLGAVDYLIKPVNLQDLEFKVRKHLNMGLR